MGLVFLVLAAGLIFVAFRTDDRKLRVFLLCCAALNLAGFAKAYLTDDPYTWRLRENPCNIDPSLPECNEPAYRP